MLFKKKSDFDGAWEERGVIGTRIEIEGDRLTVLWRNGPVLETKFKVKKTDEGEELVLAHKGLRYENSDRDYAEVTGIVVKDGKMRFTEYFPISGKSESTLEKTERSRYGDVTIVDREVLPQLQGEWTDDGGYIRIVFSGDTAMYNGDKIKIHAVKSNSSYASGEYRIIDADPSKYEVFFLANMKFEGGVLSAVIPVCDAPSVTTYFKKVK